MFQNRYRYIYILLLSIYSFLNILIINEDRLYIFNLEPIIHFLNILVLVFLIWEGNHLIQSYLVKKIDLKIHPLILQFGFSIILITSISAISDITTITILGNQSNFWENFRLTIGFTFRVNLFLNAINAIVFYLQRLKQKELENHQLRTDTVEAKFEVLRSQINPHFLFNSLNVLSNLVYKDADASAEFIEKLSNVYRYILNQRDKKLVRLEDELEFMDSYIHLLKIRFRKGIEVETNIENLDANEYLPPSSVQILIENAIKHNIVSESKPLKINIHKNGNKTLKIENTLQPRNETEHSNGVGLENIINRYKYLGKDEVAVEKTNNTFKVELPIIEVNQL